MSLSFFLEQIENEISFEMGKAMGRASVTSTWQREAWGVIV